jgi:hypothetical protein
MVVSKRKLLVTLCLEHFQIKCPGFPKDEVDFLPARMLELEYGYIDKITL